MAPVTVDASVRWPDYRSQRVGPFEVNSNLYTILFDATNNTVEAWKSTDSGATWVEVDSAGHPTAVQGDVLDSVESGGVLYVLTPGGLSAELARVYKFDTSTDTWQALESGMTTGQPTMDGSHTTGAGRIGHLAVRADGNYVVLMQGPPVSSMGSSYRKIALWRFEGGAWAEIAITQTANVHYDARSLLLVGTEVWAFYTAGSTVISVLRLDSANAIATSDITSGTMTVTAFYVVSGSSTYVDGTETRVLLPVARSTGLFAFRSAGIPASLATAPTWTQETITTTVPEYDAANRAVAFDGTTGRVLWSDFSTDDLWVNDDGGTATWAAETELADLATIEGISANKITSAIGYLYSDAGVVKYNSISLGPAGTPHTATITDALGATDAAAQTSAAQRTPTDALGMVDASTPAANYAVTISDSLGATDVATAGKQQARALTDALGATDTATATQSTAHAQTLTDALGIVDDSTRTATARPALTDPLGLVDDAGRTSAAARTSTDPLGLVDAPATEIARGRTITDGLGLVDDVTTAAPMQRTITDGLGLVDSESHPAALAREITDAEGLTDTHDATLTTGGVAHTRSVTDALGATDAAASVQSHVRALTESMEITDPTSQAATLLIIVSAGRTHSDAAGITDTLSVTLTAAGAATITDPLGLTDSATATSATGRSISDAAGLSDTVTSSLTHVRVVSGSIGATDALTTQQTTAHRVTITDELGATDAAARTASHSRTQLDALGAVDEAQRILGIARAQTDALGLVDAVEWGAGDIPITATVTITPLVAATVDVAPLLEASADLAPLLTAAIDTAPLVGGQPGLAPLVAAEITIG